MILKNKVYDYTNAKRIKEIIPPPFVKKLNISKEDNEHFRKLNDKGKFVRGVFYDFLKLMIDDCIYGNNKFSSPNKESFLVYIREKSSEEQRRLATKTSKIYVNVNMVKSDFKFYEFILKSRYLPRKKHRKIRIGYKKYKELVSEVNEGRRYFSR